MLQVTLHFYSGLTTCVSPENAWSLTQNTGTWFHSTLEIKRWYLKKTLLAQYFIKTSLRNTNFLLDFSQIVEFILVTMVLIILIKYIWNYIPVVWEVAQWQNSGLASMRLSSISGIQYAQVILWFCVYMYKCVCCKINLKTLHSYLFFTPVEA